MNDPSPQRPQAPRVWAISSYRAGENGQISGLARRLGVAWQHKRLAYRRRASVLGLLRRVSRQGVDAARSDELAPPWPDLVISAGLKNEPVARWIRAQSGGRTRLVFLGRTWAPSDRLDLLITTPQYRVPPHPHVRENLLTLHGITPERLAEARRLWEPRLSHLPRPWVGVLVGGSSGPYALGPKSARRLAETLEELRRPVGGALLVTTSARTPAGVAEVLEARLAAPVLVHRWRPDDPDNPYLGILACADRLVVTGDSVAMLSEAAASGAPVHVFPLQDAGPEDVTLQVRLYRLLMRWGPKRASRDLALFHRAYVAAGYGTWLDGAAGAGSPRLGPADGAVADGAAAAGAPGQAQAEVADTVARVRALLEGAAAPAGAQPP